MLAGTFLSVQNEVYVVFIKKPLIKKRLLVGVENHLFRMYNVHQVYSVAHTDEQIRTAPRNGHSLVRFRCLS